MHRTRTRPRSGGSNWTPLSLGANLLVWDDASDLSVQWQDSARTTAAAVNSPVGSSQNKGSLSFYMQQGTAGSRPVLRQSGGLYYWDYDGLDDGRASSAALDLTSYNEITVCIGVHKATDAVTQSVLEFSAAWTGNAASFHEFVDPASSYKFGAGSRGAAAFNTNQIASTTSATYNAAISVVMTATHDISADATALRLNGTQVGTASGDQGSGNFGNHTLYEAMRGGSTLPFEGRIYQRVIAAGVLSGGDLANLERFVAARSGISL